MTPLLLLFLSLLLLLVARGSWWRRLAPNSLSMDSHADAKETPAAAGPLDPVTFRPFRLLERRQVSPDSFVFRFALATPEQALGLPVGHHVQLRALCEVGGGEGGDEKAPGVVVQHAYTPLYADARGTMELLVKVYFAGRNPDFPRGGRLTQHLYGLKPNDTVEMRGPTGRFTYLGKGHFRIGGGAAASSKARTFHTGTFAMIGGGSGLTPLLQIIHTICQDPDDPTKVILIFANQTPEDILLREELDEIARTSQGKVKVWYTVSRNAPLDWPYDVGHITEEMLRAHLPIPERASNTNVETDKNGDGMKADETNGKSNTGKEKANKERSLSVFALVCGPHAMNKIAVKPNLEKMGYTEEDIFIF